MHFICALFLFIWRTTVYRCLDKGTYFDITFITFSDVFQRVYAMVGRVSFFIPCSLVHILLAVIVTAVFRCAGI